MECLPRSRLQYTLSRRSRLLCDRPPGRCSRRSGTTTSSTPKPGKQTILYIDLQLVHEVTSPQAFEGLRLAGRQGAPARADRGHRRPQRAHHRPLAADRRPDRPAADRHPAAELPGVRHPLLRPGRPQPGHRPRDRAGVGADPAGHDDRLRRQPHRHARGLRGPGLRHRHQRSRARAGHADPLAAQAQDAGDPRRRPAARRRHRQGPDPLDHRPDLHQRRHRLLHRVHRRGHPRPEHGRADDGLQHVDRGRRPGRPDRPGRDDLRLSARPAVRPAGFRRRRRAIGRSLPSDPGADYDRVERFHAADIEPQVTWGTNPGQVVERRRPRCPIRPSFANADRPEGGRRRPANTWACSPARRSPRSRSTACSSAPAPTGGSRTCGPRPPWSADSTSPRASRAMVVPGSGLVKRQAEAEGLDKIFTRRRLRVARGRLQHVPGDESRQARAGRALRGDQQSQLRGPAGQGRPHAPRLARHGRRRRRGRPFRRYPQLGISSNRR